jgi:hypothetical protein
MSDFILIKNLKGSLGDVYITDGMPFENTDYTLMVDVSLEEVTTKTGTGEVTPPKKYTFQPTGQIRLIKNKHDGTVTTTDSTGGDTGTEE